MRYIIVDRIPMCPDCNSLLAKVGEKYFCKTCISTFVIDDEAMASDHVVHGSHELICRKETKTN